MLFRARAEQIAWIEREQRALGAGSTRRLNRREFGAALQDVTGMIYNPVTGDYRLASDTDVNYLAWATRND